MEIKILKLSKSIDGRQPSVGLHFLSKLGDMLVSGQAFITARPTESREQPYGIRLKFSNPGVRSHPEYPQIRRQVIIEISKKTKKSKTFAGFMSGVDHRLHD